MWHVNEVLRFDEKLYRILAIRPGEVVWICIDDSTAKPEFILELTLLAYLDESRLFRNVDPFVSIHLEEPLVDSIAFKKREQGLEIIKSIIVDDKCFETKVRAQRIEQVERSGLAVLMEKIVIIILPV